MNINRHQLQLPSATVHTDESLSQKLTKSRRSFVPQPITSASEHHEVLFILNNGVGLSLGKPRLSLPIIYEHEELKSDFTYPLVKVQKSKKYRR
jgi:hypothetical protein